MQKAIRLIFMLLILLPSFGCSRGKVLLSRDPSMKVGYLAFLPTDVPKGTRPERIALVRSLVENELRRKGYLVVESPQLLPICSVDRCDRPEEIFARFGVDALVKLELTGAESRNLVVGFADSVAGTLTLTAPGGAVLESVSQKSRRTGGLLLNSGQVVEAIETQSESFRDSTFEPLAREFARALVGALSPPTGIESRLSPSLLTLGDISIERGGRRERMCLDGTPASVVVLIGEKGQGQLREVKTGRYCSALQSVRSVIASDFRAELRTPAGLQTERRFSSLVMDPTKCRLNGLVTYTGKDRTLLLRCDNPDCQSRFSACESAKKVVFRGESPQGPFKRVGEFVGRSFHDRSRGAPAPLYSVILKSPGILEENQPVIVFATKVP